MATWRDDIDALAFRPAGWDGWCMVHRLALRTLMGKLGSPEDCLSWFALHRPACEAAAQAKILRAGLAGEVNFHLTSRDIAASL